MAAAPRSLTRRLALALAVAGVVGGAGPAMAHVTVNPREATRGGFAKLAFRVPNEQSNASTVKVEVVFPDDNPVPSVTVRPTPGWRFTIVRQKLPTPLTDDDGNQIAETVSRITWEGGVIAPDEFQEFEVSLGPLPDADRMVFKALQTYDNGDVVRWIDVAAPGAKAPDHPAPVLTLTAPTSTTAPDPGSAAAPASPADSGNGLDTWAALLLAGGAIVLGAGLLLRKRSSSS